MIPLFVRRAPRALIVIAAVLAAFTVSAGAAWAYFTTTGHGSGAATTGTMTIRLEATTGDTPSTTLYPGGSADVVVHINNPNGFTVKLTDLVKAGSIQSSGGCTNADLAFNDQHGLSITVLTGSNAVHVPGVITMGLNSTSDCQGATFTIPVTATVQK